MRLYYGLIGKGQLREFSSDGLYDPERPLSMIPPVDTCCVQIAGVDAPAVLLGTGYIER